MIHREHVPNPHATKGKDIRAMNTKAPKMIEPLKMKVEKRIYADDWIKMNNTTSMTVRPPWTTKKVEARSVTPRRRSASSRPNSKSLHHKIDNVQTFWYEKTPLEATAARELMAEPRKRPSMFASMSALITKPKLHMEEPLRTSMNVERSLLGDPPCLSGKNTEDFSQVWWCQRVIGEYGDDPNLVNQWRRGEAVQPHQGILGELFVASLGGLWRPRHRRLAPLSFGSIRNGATGWQMKGLLGWTAVHTGVMPEIDDQLGELTHVFILLQRGEGKQFGAAKLVYGCPGSQSEANCPIRNIQPILLSVSAWERCLEAMRICDFLGELLCTRPPNSTMPHFHAVMDLQGSFFCLCCIEHTWLWMRGSQLNIYTGINVTYDNLVQVFSSDSSAAGKLRHRFFHASALRVFPRQVEKHLRLRVIRRIVLGLDGDAYYISHSFDESLFPADDKTTLMDPADEGNEARKLTHWFMLPTLTGYVLHPDLLRFGGMDEDEIPCDKDEDCAFDDSGIEKLNFRQNADCLENFFLMPSDQTHVHGNISLLDKALKLEDDVQTPHLSAFLSFLESRQDRSTRSLSRAATGEISMDCTVNQEINAACLEQRLEKYGLYGQELLASKRELNDEASLLKPLSRSKSMLLQQDASSITRIHKKVISTHNLERSNAFPVLATVQVVNSAAVSFPRIIACAIIHSKTPAFCLLNLEASRDAPGRHRHRLHAKAHPKNHPPLAFAALGQWRFFYVDAEIADGNGSKDAVCDFMSPTSSMIHELHDCECIDSPQWIARESMWMTSRFSTRNRSTSSCDVEAPTFTSSIKQMTSRIKTKRTMLLIQEILRDYIVERSDWESSDKVFEDRESVENLDQLTGNTYTTFGLILSAPDLLVKETEVREYEILLHLAYDEFPPTLDLAMLQKRYGHAGVGAGSVRAIVADGENAALQYSLDERSHPLVCDRQSGDGNMTYDESDHPRMGVVRHSSHKNELLIKPRLAAVKRPTRDIPPETFSYGIIDERGDTVKESMIHREHVPNPHATKGKDIRAMNKKAPKMNVVRADQQRGYRLEHPLKLKVKKRIANVPPLPSVKNPDHVYGLPLPRGETTDELMAYSYAEDWIKMNQYHQHDHEVQPPAGEGALRHVQVQGGPSQDRQRPDHSTAA
ncbi:hypothetical protein SELMODRAFT_408298 [Selaginella moellendorffii]|uniref:Uncharacterized protein n=1 Tax=Selaginella moellendorffii TaxID=88036 RepID=D8R7U8_SELML|nr:hypothetical protein SELMODRAFT_408298 [Selaginella moellendorffii]